MAAIVRFIVVLNLPILFLPGAGHDDGLYMRLAANLASGRWLGEFNQFTLMKGPGYPVFLALSGLSGLPVSATHALFQFAAIVVTAWAVYRLTASHAIAALTFVSLTFYPVGFMPELLRVVRDQIYWAQTLLVFSLLAVVFFAPPRGGFGAALVAGFAGLILGWAWLTREEGVWLIPGLGLLAAGAILIHRRQRRELLALARNIGVTAIGFVAVNAAFMTGNHFAYGSFVGVDFKERNFKSTLEALEDVDAGPVIPYVPVSNTVRAEVAKVSPAFAPLSAALAPGQLIFARWNKAGCSIYRETCGDIAGGWFMWALRDAAAESKFYRTPAAASENFGKIVSAIVAACSDGRLRCHHRWLSYMPPLTARDRAAIPGALLAVIDRIIFFRPPMPAVVYPSFIKSSDEQYLTFLHNPRIDTPVQRSYDMTVRGWFRDPYSSDWPAFKAYAEQDVEIPSSTTRLASPDLQQHFSDPSADQNRYEMSFRCPNTCTIAAPTSGHQDVRITVDRDRPMEASSGSAVLYVDSVTGANASRLINPGETFAGRVRLWLVRIYKILMPPLIFAGLFAAAIAICRAVRARALDAVLVAAFAAWALVATRVVILALIEASSLPAVNDLYAAPAIYLAVVAAFLSIAALHDRPQPARV
ncbi:MAG: hypothetical protein E7813_03485 [Bradyrhizobium sp.]|uniref:hypothetical protein n=1 Tax=Bradyrhizobium sp. TaxID=376 RepID=UPI0012273290|nr:hypothetical protein [Bradyrhizobium sp.]THD73090.1 MAG: hypothetical protein E7813_03485 [Bradyrhizobium sp.]